MTFANIFSWLIENLSKLLWARVEKKTKPAYFFFFSFFIISMIDISILFLCKYPGNLSPDSISQMRQIISGNYSNHHPFYHTMVIRLFINIGIKIWGDINAAVCFYSVFQVLFMAACFSLVVMTLYEIQVPRMINIIVIMFYGLMPYHILYSFTMWKDIIFGGFVLLYVLFVFRCIKKIGNRIFNSICLALSCIGFCVFRSNGFFAFVFTTVFFIIIWKFREKSMLTIMMAAILISFFMKHTVLNNLGVSQPDTIEALSIPAQQIARVIVECNDFTDEERELLNQVIDISAVSDNYKSYISNPIKNLVRKKGNQQLLVENKLSYLKMYLSIGKRHPVVYLKAWIDQTKGYWNAGYSYWRWSNNVTENDLGIYRITRSERFNKIVDEYIWMFSEIPLLEIFLCIGFWIWINFVMLFISLVRKDKIGVFSTLPLIMIVFSLLISTPVYSEFRYAYSVFCTIPLIIVIVLRPNDPSVQRNMEKKIEECHDKM